MSVLAHPTAQASCLAWHPVKKILVMGWDSGEIYLYANQQCSKVDSSHNASVHLAQFSAQGNSLVTADKSGTIIGWKTDTSAGARLDMRQEKTDIFYRTCFRKHLPPIMYCKGCVNPTTFQLN